ncbi:regulator [Mixta gaviniae]|uniref:Regulator n=2 Tax=Mixta gaviniae TaxID=665914 RepID=A0A1X1E098_9GAMM|nr:regulator [Mixta gaviniae]ORM82262.1 hypothetical protein HA44_07555 [Mixta gaviniae]
MTTISYGTSVAVNAKARRHARRRAAAMQREYLESIIDAAFGVSPAAAAPPRRVDKAVNLPSLREKPYKGAVCLPGVALYAGAIARGEKK